MVLLPSQILVALGVFLGEGWFLMTLIPSTMMSLMCLLDKEERRCFRDHIARCVVEGKCPLTDSRIHVAEERIAWSLMRRGGRLWEVFGIWIFLFLLVALFPFEMAAVGIKKIR